MTIELEPGTYMLECYVKRPDGTWHTELGMQQTVIVSDDEREVPAAPPEADVKMTLSNYSIELEGEIGPGSNVIEVRATDRPDGLMSHDINLFRLNEQAEVAEIVDWMDWMEPQGFRAPAPAHSLGGMEHLSPDRTGYVHLELEPGSYAWVSEATVIAGWSASSRLPETKEPIKERGDELPVFTHLTTANGSSTHQNWMRPAGLRADF